MRMRFHTTIDEELLIALKIKAAKKNIRINDILEELIYVYIKTKE